MTDQDSETDTKPENRMAQEMRKHLDSMARFTHRFVTTKAVADFHSFIGVMDTLRVLGLTPEEIATELKTTPARVSGWSMGRNLPHSSDLQSTAESAFALLERTGILFMGARYPVPKGLKLTSVA